MRDAVASARPDLLEAVIALVGDDPFERIDESTRFAQPAILCASLAGWARVADRVAQPIAFAGHSLGELTALAAAGVLEEHDALRLVVLRGRLMAESGEASGGGTMLALLGAEPAQAAALADEFGVAVANDNAPGQIVLSGAPGDLRDVRTKARAAGLRAIPLDVSGAFHSPQMAAAVAPFREALATSTCTRRAPPCSRARAPGRSPIPPSSSPRRSSRPCVAPDDDRAADCGAGAYLDPGPGVVLAKLAPRCVPDAQIVAFDDADVPLVRAA